MGGDEQTNGRRGALDTSELAILDAILERLIPTDDCGPGALEAQVSRFIDRMLVDAYGAEHLESYRIGLQAFDDLALATHGVEFASLSAERRDAVLEMVERGRGDGAGPSGVFFELVRLHAIEGMFSDPHWGGDADRVGWELIGYSGPRWSWSEADQQLERIEGGPP